MAFAPAAAITPMRTKRLSSAARSSAKSMALDGSSANRGQSPRSARAMVAMPAHYPTRSLFAYARPVAPTRGPRPRPRIQARPVLSIVASVRGEGGGQGSAHIEGPSRCPIRGPFQPLPCARQGQAVEGSRIEAVRSQRIAVAMSSQPCLGTILPFDGLSTLG
jgi:hypothetical protein